MARLRYANGIDVQLHVFGTGSVYIAERDLYLGGRKEVRAVAHSCLDCLGYGSLALVPASGHMPGHQAMLAFLRYGPVLLVDDAVYVQKR